MATLNGNARLLYWLLGIFAAAVLSIGGAWAKGVTEKADRVPAIEQRQDDQKEQMNRIEDKLDRVLQMQRGTR